jgi:nitrate reductase delta subunit
MSKIFELYDKLAGLLTYPRPGYHDKVDACHRALKMHHPEAAARIVQFAERIASMFVVELEELYTQTFDLNPVCSLEVGWHLFGENYSRGEFLVLMRQQLRKNGLPESTELPDHLTHVLAAVCRMEPHEADRFTVKYVLPALEKMLAGLAGKESPYENVLEAVRSVLLSPYGVNV